MHYFSWCWRSFMGKLILVIFDLVAVSEGVMEAGLQCQALINILC